MEFLRPEHSPQQIVPLFRILQSFSLQQYAQKLMELGYAYDLKILATSTKEQIQSIADRLNLTPADAMKFNDMIEIMRFLMPENTRTHKRSTSTIKGAEESHKRERRNSFAEQKESEDQSEDYGKLTNMIEQYNDKIDQERKEEEKQIKLKRELEEAKNKINKLTNELNQQKEALSKKPQAADSVGNDPLPTIDIRRKEVGVSYDSFRMRSTLAHLDIEEMCRCLSKALRLHIEHSLEISKSREDISPLKLSISSLPNFFQELNVPVDNSRFDEGPKVPGAVIALFRQEFDDPQAQSKRAPLEKDIYYFCKNIIFRSKMEKECSIISLIYIERMINKSGLYVNEKNWKKLILISLIIASKVWDDESYENIHFAKVFTKFSLKEINSMERLFLTLVDYDVGIKKSEYAKYYFILRTYAEKNRRSFPLKALDVDTVRKLQTNANRAEERFKNIHSESLFKTA
ncbi:unnamed protein product [Blepharisma stoltei]|uniref:Cyclin N-terminal domain-containing protein n=1 Tax=Blepharisma stoltei TaxID=1481888 RepID=A0AAU9ILZ9_9CILI|nr:unnamed protein product [Blepharisma stoltei]